MDLSFDILVLFSQVDCKVFEHRYFIFLNLY